MRAIIVGVSSDIGAELALRLIRDGWEVSGTARDAGRWNTGDSPPQVHLVPCFMESRVSIESAAEFLGKWDLLIFAVGTMEPIGRFTETDVDAWEMGVRVNAFGPLRMLRLLIPKANDGARVVFFSGPNPHKTSPTYTAYRAGKAILESLATTLQEEMWWLRFDVVAPGVVNTKILDQALKAGSRAANFHRIMGIKNGVEKTVTHDEVYERVMS